MLGRSSRLECDILATGQQNRSCKSCSHNPGKNRGHERVVRAAEPARFERARQQVFPGLAGQRFR
jgi:hypothetical protein